MEYIVWHNIKVIEISYLIFPHLFGQKDSECVKATVPPNWHSQGQKNCFALVLPYEKYLIHDNAQHWYGEPGM